MMGYFRKGEANDPVRYPLALAEILSGFPRPVIDKVTSPHGLAAKSDFMPSIKELKEACEAELRHYDLMNRPKVDFRPTERRIPRVTPNLWVPEDNNRYAKVVEMSKHPSAVAGHMTYFEDRADKDGVLKRGIWIPLGWWEDKGTGSFKSLAAQKPTQEEKAQPEPDIADDEDFIF